MDCNNCSSQWFIPSSHFTASFVALFPIQNTTCTSVVTITLNITFPLSIFSFMCLTRAVVSLLWQTAVPTLRSQRVLLSVSGISGTLSTLRFSLSAVFHNSSGEQHAQTKAVVCTLEKLFPLFTKTAPISGAEESYNTRGAWRGHPVTLCCFYVAVGDWHDEAFKGLDSPHYHSGFLTVFFFPTPLQMLLTWQCRKRNRTLELWIIRP